MNLKFYKTCGICERKLKNNEIVWCKNCEKYKSECIELNCVKCSKKHYRTESIDWNYKGMCRECFFEEFENYKTPKKVLDELEKMELNYKKKYG